MNQHLNGTLRCFHLPSGCAVWLAGTVQLMCMANVLRNAAGVSVTAQVSGVTATDVAAAAAATAAKQQGSGRRASTPPGLLLTTMPLAQQCYGRVGGKASDCPVPDVRTA